MLPGIPASPCPAVPEVALSPLGDVSLRGAADSISVAPQSWESSQTERFSAVFLEELVLF